MRGTRRDAECGTPAESPECETPANHAASHAARAAISVCHVRPLHKHENCEVDQETTSCERLPENQLNADTRSRSVIATLRTPHLHYPSRFPHIRILFSTPSPDCPPNTYNPTQTSNAGHAATQWCHEGGVTVPRVPAQIMTPRTINTNVRGRFTFLCAATCWHGRSSEQRLKIDGLLTSGNRCSSGGACRLLALPHIASVSCQGMPSGLHW